MRRSRLVTSGIGRREVLAGLSGVGLSGVGAAGALFGGLAPRLARADEGERCFLFVFCRGGWDTGRVFCSHQGVPGATIEADEVEREVSGLRFVESPGRPEVSRWFERHAGSACVINGIEVPSVAHERCRKMIMADEGSDDWATRIAAGSTRVLPMPHVVIAGPCYASLYADSVVRVGEEGQLGPLLDGTALAESNLRVTALPGEVEALADLAARDSAARRATGAGPQAAFADDYLRALSSVEDLRGAEGLSFVAQAGICARDLDTDLANALSGISLGLSRSAMLQYNGYCDLSWDSHMDLSLQSKNYEELFAFLDRVVSALAEQGLSDRVTVVVLSEMGRHPMQNSTGGRDHWTFTSALLFGAGVRGGQVIGGVDSYALGVPVSLATGEVDSGGERLGCGHLGATLLALADIDPVVAGVQAPPITAALA